MALVEITDEMVKTAKEICKQYGIITPPETMLRHGMDDIINKDGSLAINAKGCLEKGVRLGMFGDEKKEHTWSVWMCD